MMRAGNDHPGARGFTLIELLLAVAITGMVMTAVGGAFLGILRTREEVRSLSESASAGPRILALIDRDLRALWHHNIKENRVLLGRNRDIAGFDADRIDFITTTDAIGAVTDTTDQPNRPTLCEVGYWMKPNDRYPDLRELWRREDPLVDNDLSTGGNFQLIHDRIKNFNITYYETLGAKAEAFHEWDSSKDAELPRRIQIEFEVERKMANRNRVTGAEVGDLEGTVKKYVRHIVLDPRYPEILQAGRAMVAVVPPRPAESADGPLGGGGAGPAG
ncbi:MAG: prepilin-type N-terminal cleavage/methylation domain-containing protein [Planctomycetota bacterium]